MGGLTITRVTHAGVLLDFNGQVVLTDPWWVDRTLERHGEPVGVAVADLPKLAGVTVTHNVHTHYDMIGFGAYPDKSVPIVVPRGAAAPARKAGFSSVIELDPWETASLGRVRVGLHWMQPRLWRILEEASKPRARKSRPVITCSEQDIDKIFTTVA